MEFNFFFGAGNTLRMYFKVLENNATIKMKKKNNVDNRLIIHWVCCSKPC